MSKIHTFPKIFPVGSDFIPNLFKGPVEITEKIDGSQFGFGITMDGEIVVRSKGKEMLIDNPERMFEKATQYVESIADRLRNIQNAFKADHPLDTTDVFFYGEFMGGPSHNILKYDRIPKNHIMIFGVNMGGHFIDDYESIVYWASQLDLEAVPLVYKGEIATLEELLKFLETDSILGHEKLEGIVVKNYKSPAILGNMVIPSMGKFVRDDFKERHATDWGPKFSMSNKLQLFIDSFQTEARWHKAIQHLKEAGELTNSPKDIGKLMLEIERDVLDEEKENIKTWLYNHFKEQIIRKARAGFPEFYKKHIAENAFKQAEPVGGDKPSIRDSIEWTPKKNNGN